jgi:hypothetical protein
MKNLRDSSRKRTEEKLRSGAGENKIQMGNGGTRKPDIGAETRAMRTENEATAGKAQCEPQRKTSDLEE